MLYPLKFEPVYKNIIWGGRNIEKKFKRQIPEGNIGESWELCCRDNGMSCVSNGPLKGKTIDEIIECYKEKVVGNNFLKNGNTTFPLLIKIIDANDKLSVQVHPDDDYAKGLNIGCGKNELWYIIDAKPGSKLIYGLKKNISKQDFINSLCNHSIQELLNVVAVKPGDVFYIPAGTVHAIMDGILIAEIQQNSDTTYRIYDWDRADSNGKFRELHLDNALDVINFDCQCNMASVNETATQNDSYSIKQLARNKYFTVEELDIEHIYTDKTDSSSFYIYMIIEGEGVIAYDQGEESVCSGDTLMIPASMGQYDLIGKVKVLKTYI